MTTRYVLTSACIQNGTMTLTLSLRRHLQGRERARFVDEDGEVYEVEVDWKAGVVRGLGPYYAKRRLAVNEAVLLHFRGEEVELQAAPRSAPRGEPKEARPAPSLPPEEPKRRVRVTPYPKEVLFPHEPKRLEPPGVSEDLGRLGFVLEGGPPWVYKASLGRRQVVLALLRLGEGEPEDLKPFRRQGAYTAYLAPESQKASLPEGVGFVSPEALSRLLRLKGRFPLSSLDLEDLLRQGRVDLEAVEALEDRLVAEFSERGAFASLLLLLAKKPMGEVFLLADLEAEALEEGLIPEVVRQGVETLAQPPFLLLKRLSPGEFLLRQGVEEALEDLMAFAQGLKARLSRVRSA
ncbi:hypothetical protein GCM10007092_01360 [Thermus composti]|uniref:Uncharacterized protein n=1 Tax=Thermus composti TaxID=532059 RepID=A0ABV6PZG4_9DEIN|nr:hypothetical protein [Thermus composti]GGM92071.1 hypothetical protein GCM10007092_01360 [Thermus composti]